MLQADPEWLVCGGPSAVSHHYVLLQPTCARAGLELASLTVGPALEAGVCVAALQLEPEPCTATFRARIQVSCGPCIGEAAWISLRAADGTDVLALWHHHADRTATEVTEALPTLEYTHGRAANARGAGR